MRKLIPYLVAVALVGAGAAYSGKDVTAGEAAIAGVAGGSFNVSVNSLVERRWQTVVRQQYDYSCGAAAVATLLTYHYGRETGEAEVYEVMFETGDQDRIRQMGFSYLDMKRYLIKKGLLADGFRVDLPTIQKIGVPVVTLITIEGYRHFVVVKGVTESDVILGDPALGIRKMPRDEFQEMWNGTILAVRNKSDEGHDNFNHARDWEKLPSSPLDQGLTRDTTASWTMHLPTRGEFY